MTFTTELQCLTWVCLATALMWIPYILARMATRGIMATMGNPDPSLPADPAWADRAHRAHTNAVENLVLFAPLVIMAAMLGISTPLTVIAAKAYLAARVAHYFIYAAGIPVLRTLAFAVGFLAQLAFVAALLGIG